MSAVFCPGQECSYQLQRFSNVFLPVLFLVYCGISSAVSFMSATTMVLQVQSNKDGIFECLPPELMLEITMHTRAADLCSLRLSSPYLAEVGKIELQLRLRSKKTVSTATVQGRIERCFVDKLLDVNHLFSPSSFQNIAFINIWYRQQRQVSDDALAELRFPSLNTIWFQNVRMADNIAIKRFFLKHASTLKDVRISMCELNRPAQFTQRLYSRHSWHPVLALLSSAIFKLEFVELQNIHLCPFPVNRFCASSTKARCKPDLFEMVRIINARLVPGYCTTVADHYNNGIVKWIGDNAVKTMLEHYAAGYRYEDKRDTRWVLGGMATDCKEEL